MKTFSLILIFSGFFLNVQSQKLPKIQLESVRAPANAKVDGKPTEWNQMHAYNPSAEIFYTIANDDKKLYLVVQSNVPALMNKLVNGGVTLLIQKSGKKSDAGAVGAKFPFMEKGKIVGVSFYDDSENGSAIMTYDAIIADNNKRLSTEIKWIYIKGLLGKDSLISVYNDAGILAANAVTSKRVYTSEIAIDLRLLGLSSGGPKFSYHIIVNGEPNRYVVAFSPEQWHVKSRDGTPVSQAQVQEGLQRLQTSYSAASSTSDFWGEYTLAK